jgi:hypothetical protein
MDKRIFPNWEQISNFKTPLTDGELALAKFLDANLPIEWEIYLQPYLNGDRPDLVILNQSVGIVIFEIKDWFLKNYHTKEESFLDKNYQQQKKTKYFFSDRNGEYLIQSPVSQVERYRKNLINLYLPQIGDAVDSNTKNLSAFKVALYFHNATTSEARKFISCPSTKCVVFGKDLLNKKSLHQIVLDVNLKNSYSMRQNWAEEIKFWLKPTFHSLEQGQSIQLTPEQMRHAKPSPGQHQRLRGVAGSGKTLIIAQRAANLASQGKKVLIITFNITLWHYIRDYVSRTRFGFDWERLEFRHFHGFCADFLKENGIPWPSDTQEEELFNRILPELVLEKVKININEKNRNYDAILIDEGQDFQKLYYEVLCGFLSPNDELLFVVDEKQNIYGRELSWINAMEGTRFRGKWRELKESYRLPITVLEQINKFAEMFLPNVGLVPLPKLEQRSLFEPHLRWKDINSFEDAKQFIWKTIKFLTKKQGIHPQDIVVLVPSHSEGLKLVNHIEIQGFKVNHVFEDDKRNHNNKKAFWMGDSRLKMSTIYSFKGWEILNVIILTAPNGFKKTGENLDSLLYVALTRPRQNLIVFNRNSEYQEYGKGWLNNWYPNDTDVQTKNDFDEIPF